MDSFSSLNLNANPMDYCRKMSSTPENLLDFLRSLIFGQRKVYRVQETYTLRKIASCLLGEDWSNALKIEGKIFETHPYSEKISEEVLEVSVEPLYVFGLCGLNPEVLEELYSGIA